MNDDVKTLIRYSNGTTATQHVLNCVAKNWYILSESHRHHHQIKRFQLLLLLQKRVFENNNSTCCIIRIWICVLIHSRRFIFSIPTIDLGYQHFERVSLLHRWSYDRMGNKIEFSFRNI